MWNFGTDAAAWLVTVQIVIVTLAVAWFAFEIIQAVKRCVNGASNADVFTHSFFRRCCIKLGVVVALILTFFVHFGAGKHQEQHPAEDNSHRKMLEAQPEPPVQEEVKAEAKAKVDPFLRQIDESPEKVRNEANDYVNEVLKRNVDGGAKK